tara:strand:+ start:1086 stop:1271 length:186 start_codon:yes stop_codon:yes gene_type:complete
MKLLESQKQMIKTATRVQLQNALKETIKLKEAIEQELNEQIAENILLNHKLFMIKTKTKTK